MNPIENGEASEAFVACWRAAGAHLNRAAGDRIQSWLRAHPYPPFLEHLSFRLGNQLFFVRIEDAKGALAVPGSREGVRAIADGCNGHACLMPMQKAGADWFPVESNWGLLSLDGGRPIDPIALVSDDDIPMTDWEVHDFAVQVVRDFLAKQGCQLMSWQGNPSVDPAIWFVGQDGPEWVVVRAVKFPDRQAPVPADIGEIARHCAGLGARGHFASVAVASQEATYTALVLLHPYFVGMASLSVSPDCSR